VKLEIESPALPVLVMLMVWGAEVVLTNWFPKLLKLAGENDSAGAVPVPDKDAVCGLPPRVSLAIESIAERLPDAVGANVTLILQMVLGARAVPHVVLCAKSPLIEIELMLSVALPAFVSVMVWAALVVPTN
jgi:hypothetical protein